MPENDKLPTKKGKVGRKPGVPNASTITVKEAFQQAFDLLDGPEGLARWAGQKVRTKHGVTQPNLGAFYELAAKLIPSESRVSGTTDHRHYVAREIAVEKREAISAPGGKLPPIEAEYAVISGQPAHLESNNPGVPDAPENWL